MAQRLDELAAEAARLAELGQRLDATNPVVRALLADFEDVLKADGVIINAAAEGLQAGGIDAAGTITRQMVLGGYTDDMLRLMGVQWNRVNPDVVARFVNYARSDEWAAKLRGIQGDILQAARNTVYNGIASGWGPLKTARELRNVVDTLPAYLANTQMRTLFLTSYRDAAVLHRMANADILTEQIRVAALDDRTCMACVALHGTRLPLDARIDDHWNGRCTSVTVVRGRTTPDVQTGEDWFTSRSPAQQRDMLGPARYDAWKAGEFQLADLAKTTTDPLFGGMVQEASLRGVLGDGAEQYYARK